MEEASGAERATDGVTTDSSMEQGLEVDLPSARLSGVDADATHTGARCDGADPPTLFGGGEPTSSRAPSEEGQTTRTEHAPTGTLPGTRQPRQWGGCHGTGISIPCAGRVVLIAQRIDRPRVGFVGQHRRRRRCGCLRASDEVAARGRPVCPRGCMQADRRSRRKSGWPREGLAGKSPEPTVADARAREALGPEPGVAWKGADTESQRTFGWARGRVTGRQRTTSHREVSTRDRRGNPWSR